MNLIKLEFWQLALLFLPLLFIFLSLWHIVQHEFIGTNEKYIWLFLCTFLPVIGTVIYLIFGIRRIKPSIKI